MTEKEVKRLLKKANEEWLFYNNVAESIAILQRVHNEFPNEIKYLGLLASYYYKAGEYDLALECCDKADSIDLNNANTLDLRGLIAYEKKDKKQAEIYYREALQKEPLLVECRLKLIELLFDEERYEDTIIECQFILKFNDPDRENYSEKDKKNIFLNYLSIVYFRYKDSLIYLKRYEEAIVVIQEYIKSRSTTIKDPYFFDIDDRLLLKLYFVINDQEGIDKYTDRWLNFYKVDPINIDRYKKDAEQGYLLSLNPDNYQ